LGRADARQLVNGTLEQVPRNRLLPRRTALECWSGSAIRTGLAAKVLVQPPVRTSHRQALDGRGNLLIHSRIAGGQLVLIGAAIGREHLQDFQLRRPSEAVAGECCLSCAGPRRGQDQNGLRAGCVWASLAKNL